MGRPPGWPCVSQGPSVSHQGHILVCPALSGEHSPRGQSQGSRGVVPLLLRQMMGIGCGSRAGGSCESCDGSGLSDPLRGQAGWHRWLRHLTQSPSPVRRADRWDQTLILSDPGGLTSRHHRLLVSHYSWGTQTPSDGALRLGNQRDLAPGHQGQHLNIKMTFRDALAGGTEGPTGRG